MNCSECGIPATKVGESAVATIYRCPRSHYTRIVKSVEVQDDMFKSPERVRDEAIARVDESHDTWIERIAIPAILQALQKNDGRITTDDVWREIGDVSPPEPRAMGAAMMRAKRGHFIRPTSEWVNSSRADCHARPIRVWART